MFCADCPLILHLKQALAYRGRTVCPQGTLKPLDLAIFFASLDPDWAIYIYTDSENRILTQGVHKFNVASVEITSVH